MDAFCGHFKVVQLKMPLYYWMLKYISDTGTVTLQQNLAHPEWWGKIF